MKSTVVEQTELSSIVECLRVEYSLNSSDVEFGRVYFSERYSVMHCFEEEVEYLGYSDGFCSFKFFEAAHGKSLGYSVLAEKRDSQSEFLRGQGHLGTLVSDEIIKVQISDKTVSVNKNINLGDFSEAYSFINHHISA